MQEHHHFGYTIKKINRLGRGSFGYVDEVELYNSNGDLCPGKYARKTFNPSKKIRQSMLNLAQIRERFMKKLDVKLIVNHSMWYLFTCII